MTLIGNEGLWCGATASILSGEVAARYTARVAPGTSAEGTATMDAINLAIVAGKVFLATKPTTVARLRSYIRGRNRVIVVGSTGAGKTQLIDSLSDLLPPAISYLDRTGFASSDDLQVGKQFFRVWDTPGQASFAGERSTTIRAVSSKPFGVINVVAYGYHEYRADLTTLTDSTGQVRGDYLKRHRELEIKQLRSIIPHLVGNPNLRWFLTVVAKADLWWDEKDTVLDYYERGKYADAYGPLGWLGGPVVLEHCSVMHPFYNRVPISGHYSDDDRRRGREQLLASLLTAIAKPK